ncbi:MAG TPA: GtrA family protein [Pseudomonadales bacterium]|jgi:putative flippase GtrA
MIRREFFNPQFVRFLISGGIAAAANFGSRIGYEYWLHCSYSTAIILAYLTGMIVAFTLYKKHVFEPGKHHTAREALHFCIINVLAVAQTLVISIALADYVLPAASITMFTKEIAHAAGVVTPIFTSFLGHKYFTFRTQHPSELP